MQKLVFTNGGGQTIDLTSGNFGITNWEGLSGVGLNIQTQQVPFQDGGVFLDALMEQREISVTVAIQDNNDLEARYELKRQLISALNPKLGEGVLVYTNDYLSRQIKAVPQLPIFENKNSNDAGTLKASVVFSCPSPYWEDLQDIETTINEYAEITNDGDVPAQVVIDIQEGSSNPTIINQTTGKILQLSGNFEDGIAINTNIGQKSVKTEKMAFKWLSGGIFSSIASNGAKILYNGTQDFIIDRYTGKREDLIQLRICHWVNNEFIGINGNKLYTSEDGKTWTEHITGLPAEFSDVNYLNGYYYVVTDFYSIYRSSDKINWQQVKAPLQGGGRRIINCIDYLNEKYIAGSMSGYILQSDDGETWTEYNDSQTQTRAEFRKIIYQDGKYYSATSYGLYTSLNGISWTAIENISYSIFDLIYVNEIFVAVGEQGKAYTSIDGTTWTERQSGTTKGIRKIIYTTGSFFVCGDAGLMGRSRNGKDWNIQTTGIGSEIYKMITVKGTLAILCYNTLYFSNDGMNLEEKYQLVGESIDDLIYANNKYLMLTSGRILMSSDGNNWEEYSISFNATKIAYSEKLHLYVAIASKNVYTSADCVTWTEYQNVSGANLNGIIYIEQEEMFVLAGGLSTIIISENGIDWTTVNSVQTGGLTLRYICYGNGVFLVSDGSNVFISENGIEWELESLPSSVRYLDYGNNLFTGASGKIITSKDGRNWTERESEVNVRLNTGTSFKNDIFCAGLSGVINQSYTKERENIIDKLTTNSDMTFNLVQGKNNILITDDNNRRIKVGFRQKYIGV